MLIYMTFIMLVMHIIADYMLQTDLMAKAKQKQWWKDNYPDDKYCYDWLIALGTHSFEWAFFIEAPLVVYDYLNYGFRDIVAFFIILTLIINSIIHGVIDNVKANKLSISLAIDQAFHILQITITFVLYIILINIINFS